MTFGIQCPACHRKLNVPDTLLNKRVKCPSCGEAFTATPTPTKPEDPQKARPPLTEAIAPAPERPVKPSAAKIVSNEPDAETEFYEPEKKPAPRRRSRDDDDDDDDDEPRPARRRRNDDDYRSRNRSRPHRGGLILTLGILGLFVWCCPIAGWVVGGIVLNMANKDLVEMAVGNMDDSGRGITLAGKICAIVALVLATLNAIAGAVLRVTDNI